MTDPLETPNLRRTARKISVKRCLLAALWASDRGDSGTIACVVKNGNMLKVAMREEYPLDPGQPVPGHEGAFSHLAGRPNLMT